MSIEITISSSFEVECSACGQALEALIGGRYAWGSDAIKVEPCPVCMKNAAEEAVEEMKENE